MIGWFHGDDHADSVVGRWIDETWSYFVVVVVSRRMMTISFSSGENDDDRRDDDDDDDVLCFLWSVIVDVVVDLPFLPWFPLISTMSNP
jgi:hypothetical protein